MDPISIPYHLVIITLLSLGVLLLIFIKRKELFKHKYWKWFWISTVVFLFFYTIIVGGAMVVDIYYQWDLNKYDLNQDGFFSGEEQTIAQKKAMIRLTSDVGRNLSPLFGGLFSIVISIPILVVGLTITLVKEKLIKKTDSQNE
jgi:hypothetical protein